MTTFSVASGQQIHGLRANQSSAGRSPCRRASTGNTAAIAYGQNGPFGVDRRLPSTSK